MSDHLATVPVVGATGSIGRLVVEEARREGCAARVREDLAATSGRRPAGD